MQEQWKNYLEIRRKNGVMVQQKKMEDSTIQLSGNLSKEKLISKLKNLR